VKTIIYRLTEDSHETITNTCDKLGVSLRQFIDEAVFEFLTLHKHDISRRQKKHYEKESTRELMSELFFMKNFYRRIVQIAMPQCMLRGECEHEIINAIVNKAEDYFKTLDVNNQVLVGKQLEFLQQFKEKKYFETWIETRLPEAVKQLRSEEKRK